jgi:hypothetical protein
MPSNRSNEALREAGVRRLPSNAREQLMLFVAGRLQTLPDRKLIARDLEMSPATK